MNHYVYRIDRPSKGEWYIGMHQCEGPPVLDTKYMGSGTQSSPMIMAHPEEFIKTILMITATRASAARIEAALVPIERVDDDPLCLNLCAGGGNSREMSEETRAKMSVAAMGNTNTLGFRHSEESRDKMSKVRVGVPIHTLESRAKISASNRRRKYSAETLQKMRVANLGRVHTEESRAKMRVANIGRKHTELSKAKMRQAKLGTTHSEATRAKMRESQRLRRQREKV